MPEPMPPVPERFVLTGDQPVAVFATAPAESAPTLEQWTRRLVADRLITAAKVGPTVDEEDTVAVMKTHPSRVTDVAESAPACVTDLFALPVNCIPLQPGTVENFGGFPDRVG